jgi:hypothetical protein
VAVDTNNTRLKAILLQKGQPIAFASRSLLPVEKNYSTNRKLLIVIFGVKKFRYYLIGCPFIVWTDDKPLINSRERVIKAWKYLSMYEIIFKYILDQGT